MSRDAEFESEGILFSTVLNMRAPTARANAAAVERQIAAVAHALAPLEVVAATRRRGDLLDVVVLPASGLRQYASARN